MTELMVLVFSEARRKKGGCVAEERVGKVLAAEQETPGSRTCVDKPGGVSHAYHASTRRQRQAEPGLARLSTKPTWGDPNPVRDLVSKKTRGIDSS